MSSRVGCPGPLLAATPEWAAAVGETADHGGAEIGAALDAAVEVGRVLPYPGRGETAARWAALATIARAQLTVARVVEAHTDALSIEAECDGELIVDGRTWGVFAAEGGTDPLTATEAPGGYRLSGTKPWCSLGGVLDAALVTARVGEDRQLFAVELGDPGVTAHDTSGWVSRGLPSVTSAGLDFDDVPARAVGAPGWYLTRPGFAWGGMGVAACWYGAAEGVADALRDRLAGDAADPVRTLHLGRVDVALHAAACVLADAADSVDSRSADGDAGAVLALRVRAVVAAAAETVLREVGHALGPAPLAFDERHAARVADLQIYVRQHHGERDLHDLGAALRHGDRA